MLGSARGRWCNSTGLLTTAGELKIWDVESGRELRTVTAAHADLVNAVALSGNGRRAVSAARDKTLKVWDVESGVLLATFTCEADVGCCAFVNERKLIAGDGAGGVHFLSLEEPKAKS
jgi:WD40 repeat protein